MGPAEEPEYAADADVVDQLRARGLRVTRPRTAVYGLLSASGRHWDVMSIAERVRDGLGTISVQAVYDVLHALVQAGLVRRIEPSGLAALFEARTGDNHHHLVCNRCASVVDIDCEANAVPCLQPSQDHGFVIDEAEICWYGLCAECAAGDDGTRPRAATS